MAVSWVLELVDRISPAARRAKESLAGVGGELRKLRETAAGGGKALTTAGDAARRAAGGFSTATGALRGLGGGMSSAAAGIGKMAGALAALQVGQKLLDLAGAGVAFVAHTQTFKSDIMFSFGVLKGTQEGAAALLDRADVFARALGQKTSDTGEKFRELLASGFTQDQTESIVSAMADIRAANPKADTETISKQLGQLMGAGKITEEDIKPIRDAGLNDAIYYQVLREMTGIKDQKALKKKLQSNEGISSDIGLAAILETVRRQSGEDTLGQLAAKRANETVGGAIDRLKAQWERLFIFIDSSPVGASIQRIALRLSALLDPTTESGQRFLAILDRVAVVVGDVLDGLFTDNAISRGIASVQAFGETVMRVVGPLAGGLVAGLKEGFGIVLSVVERLGISLDGDMTGAFENVGRVAGWLLTILVGAIGITASWGAAISFFAYQVIFYGVKAVTWFGKAWFDLFAMLGGFLGRMYDAGANLGSALLEGLKSGAGALWDGVKRLLGLVPDATESTLQIRSPSRVMMRYGAFAAAGFTLGLASGAPEAQLAARALAKAALPPGPSAAALGPPLGTTGGAAGAALGARSSGGGGGTVITVTGNTITVVVEAHEAAGLDVDGLAARIGGKLATALYDGALARGAIPPAGGT